MNASIVYARDDAGKFAVLYVGDDAEPAASLMDNLDAACEAAGLQETVKVHWVRRGHLYKRREVLLGTAREKREEYDAKTKAAALAYEEGKRNYRTALQKAQEAFASALKEAELIRSAPERAAAEASAKLAEQRAAEKQAAAAAANKAAKAESKPKSK